MKLSDRWTRECLGVPCDEHELISGRYLTDLTFCGVLEEYYEAISRNWNDATKQKYNSDYDRVILPNIVNHNQKKIHEYNCEDCDQIINAIAEKGYVFNGERKEYADSQIRHFRYLIFVVFQYAYLSGICNDILWGTKFCFKNEEELTDIVRKTKIKRSLSITQEQGIKKKTMQDPAEHGSLVGVMLMFSLGVRDGEACGLDFGDICILPNHKGCYVATIKQSVIPNTCILQSSGKTYNSGRRIPIPTKAASLILERRKIIKQKAAKKGLQIDIDRVPVAGDYIVDNNTKDFYKRLKADMINDAAKKVYKEIGLEPEMLGLLEIEMEEERHRFEIDESHVTAYLLRRNFATHLKILGLEPADRQYVLGHCIEDPYISRTDYTDEKLYELYEKMKYRPLVNDQEEERCSIELVNEKVCYGKKIIEVPCDEAIVNVQITALEKQDVLRLKPIIKDPDNVAVTIYKGYVPYEKSRKINILKTYTKAYEKEKEVPCEFGTSHKTNYAPIDS